MKKSITFIEVIIVLCVIVVSVKLWIPKKTEVKTLSPTPKPISNTATTMPIIKIEKFLLKALSGQNIVILLAKGVVQLMYYGYTIMKLLLIQDNFS
jgi:hypothetical protein